MDISYKKCVSGKPATIKANLYAAMRNAVSNQVFSFRAENLKANTTCHWKGCTLDVVHVDHVKPFKELADKFLASKHEYEIPDKFGDHPKSNAAVFLKEDEAFQKDWEAYHEKFATLVLSCDKCNLERK